MGMSGFDSKVNGYVSMTSHVTRLVNPGCKTIKGEYNYALAA